MIKIALFGGPGAGKTTLANALAAAVKDRGVQFYAISEYAREFIDTYGPEAIGECGPLIQHKFSAKQKAKEEQASKTAGFVTDSPLFLSWIYSAFYPASPVVNYIARKDAYKEFLKSIENYSLIVQVKREKGYIQDGTRSQTEEEAIFIDQAIETVLKLHRVPFITVSGTTKDRVDELLEQIDGRITES